VTQEAAASLDEPVWYAPLRSPSWLVPGVRDGAPVVAFGAEPWPEGVDTAGRDLRLGFPLYLAEALRFGTNARAIAIRGAPDEALDEAPAEHGASITVRTAVAPEGSASIRVRMFDERGEMLAEADRRATDEASLGEALASLPFVVAEAAAPVGVRPIWNSLYTLPHGAALTTYVRGQHACRRTIDDVVPDDAPAERVAERRADVSATLRGLGDLATSTPEPFAAMLFFGALLAARDTRSPVVGDFRLPANARCTAATDPLDPVYAMAALVLRVFGDRDASERRIGALRSTGDPAMVEWLDRIQAIP
jgi:hypothetical protein